MFPFLVFRMQHSDSFRPENVPLKRKKEKSCTTTNAKCLYRGGYRISGKGVNMYMREGVRLADFISFFLNIPQ